MAVVFQLKQPDDLVAVLQITMTVGQFRELKKQLQGSYPSWDLSRAITDVIIQAEKTFYAGKGDDSNV